jgi:type II secretory pathway component PulK
MITRQNRQHRCGPSRRKQRRQGFIIVIATIVILLVSLAAYSFLAMMVSENKAARAQGDQLQAACVAFSGREYLAAILELPRSRRPQESAMDSLDDLYRGVLVDGESELRESLADTDEREGRFSLLVADSNEMESKSYRFGYENESRKLNLAALVQWDQQRDGAGREALMNLPGMDESTADAILDWCDADDTSRALGAESEYYSGLEPPYQPRNGTPASLEELLLVRGVTREQLFGADLNANFRIDPFESELLSDQATANTGEQDLPWSSYLTVWSGERDVSYEGSPRVRVNQSDLRSLHQQLSRAGQTSWANFIIAYRQFGPYEGSEPSEDAANHQVDFNIPAAHQIESLLDLIDIRVAIRNEEKVERVLASPFTEEPSSMQQYLPKLFDSVSVGDGRPIIGRVNVNLAPREVLLGIPGIESSVVESVLASRGTSGQAADDRQHAVWLLTESVISRTTMRELLPFMTAGGDVGRAQIIGYYDQRSAVMRFETVIDATSIPARQVYYKDLRRLGRGALAQVIGTADTW